MIAGRYLAPCLALLATGLLWSASTAEDVSSKTKAKAAEDFVIHCHEGGLIRPATLLGAIEIQTKLGKLTVRASEARHIDFGFRVPEEAGKQIEAALADLANENFAKREAATKQLTTLGRLAYPRLKDRPAGDELEVRRRLEAIVKAIEDRVPAELLKVREGDMVRTSDLVLRGRVVLAVGFALVLRRPAQGSAGVRLTREAHAAWERVSRWTGDRSQRHKGQTAP
jgi:hypothetical protein